uniref:EsV-1-7 n=1 Tax=Guillardia theta TaxID=55529 RepID=A0A6U6DXA4_GUITH|mmetsp:Transcript_8374/g.28119  ORF Transcript_8374/g.28119 Transcript_8374/m.28119 type:complete len:248 (+) Transcript_8374:135-878(+)
MTMAVILGLHLSTAMLCLLRICSLFHVLSSASILTSSSPQVPANWGEMRVSRYSRRPEDSGTSVPPKKKRSSCKEAGCSRQPSFGSKQARGPVFCSEHRRPEDIDLRNRRCMYAEGCSRWPFYGNQYDRVKMFCWEHKNESHVDVVRKRCEHEGCERWPSFAEVGQSSPSFCRKHALSCHVDVKHKRCVVHGCSRQPIFGSPQGGRMVHCARHKQEDEVDLKHLVRTRKSKGQDQTNSSSIAAHFKP